MNQFEPLPADSIVYRAMLRKQWIDEDTGRVKADAYFLRTNEFGLSVNLASVCSPEQCAKEWQFNNLSNVHLLILACKADGLEDAELIEFSFLNRSGGLVPSRNSRSLVKNRQDACSTIIMGVCDPQKN